MTLASEKHVFANLTEVAARAVEIRHDLHRHPELGYQEIYTSNRVCEELSRLRISFKKGLAGGTGVMATLKGAEDHGKCVALRADMDALPITEPTGKPYASTRPGLMHACGHDGHTAILLGAAAILKENTDKFRGTIKLLFQPAEEGGCGAQRMCDDGVLENPKVDAIFGLHGWPGLKVGMAASRPGALLAAVDGFTIVINGRGGHAAAPHTAIDPFPCVAALIQSLQTIVSREADPTDASVLTIGEVHGGATFNVIPDSVQLSGTLRSLSAARREAAIASVDRIAHGIAAAHRCEATVTYFGQTPCTANTPELTEFVAQTAAAVLGAQAYVALPKPAMWGEDFAFYLERVPGCFFVLGVQPHDRDSYPMLHNPGYDFTDAAVPIGIRMMVKLGMGFLRRGA